MHQAEKYVKQIIGKINSSGYMRDFLKQGKDKQAVAEIAVKLKQFKESMSLLRPIAIQGFMVPSGSLMLYQYLKEDLEAVEEMLRQERTGKKVLPAEQNEEMQKRIGIVKHRLMEMMELLLSQHIADQIEQRTDEAAAQSAFRENGYLPLYLDEKTMGIVYNTLTMQLLLDRFNVIFNSVFEPMTQDTIKTVVTNVLAPYWKQHTQSILFSMEDAVTHGEVKE